MVSLAYNKVSSRARPLVLLHYMVARQQNVNLELFIVPLRFEEKALLVFSSERTAQTFTLSRTTPEWEWHVRACSAGELVSLLLGLYADINWILLDPLPRRALDKDMPENLVRCDDFIDYLLEHSEAAGPPRCVERCGSSITASLVRSRVRRKGFSRYVRSSTNL